MARAQSKQDAVIITGSDTAEIIHLLRLADIMPDPDQPRKVFAEDQIRELAGSIAARGLIQPITVRRNAAAGRSGPRFIITAGERRWRAHCLLRDEKQLPKGNSGTIKAIIREQSNEDKTIDSIIENLQRVDISPMEEARAFHGALQMPGWDKERLAKALGIVPFKIAWRVSLLDLDPDIQTLVQKGDLQPQYAMEMAKVAHVQQRALLAQLNRGDIKGWAEMRAAVGAIKEAASQDSFLSEEIAPRTSAQDRATVSGMEQKIERLARLVASGWDDGECVTARRVAPDQARLMAEKIAATMRALKIMERDLRSAATQTELLKA